jgi:hypothetical protein
MPAGREARGTGPPTVGSAAPGGAAPAPAGAPAVPPSGPFAGGPCCPPCPPDGTVVVGDSLGFVVVGGAFGGFVVGGDVGGGGGGCGVVVVVVSQTGNDVGVSGMVFSGGMHVGGGSVCAEAGVLSGALTASSTDVAPTIAPRTSAARRRLEVLNPNLSRRTGP